MRITDYHTEYKVSVPIGKSGDWEISKFEITESAARLSFITELSRFVTAGTFTQLTHHDDIVMSDTRAEIDDHRELFHRATGHVLLNGLGLGVALSGVARKPEVTQVTVVENSPDVIALVAEHYQKLYPGKITIIEADALVWFPPKGQVFGAVWHDIWPAICSDNLRQMAFLHRRYGRRAHWQSSWCWDECKRGRQV